MALHVKRNLLEGARASSTMNTLHTEYLIVGELEEIAMVSGVDGLGTFGEVIGDGSIHHKFWQAMHAVDADDPLVFIPELNTFYAYNPESGFLLCRITCEGVAPDIVKLHLFWARVGYIKSEMRNYLTSAETNKGWTTLVDDESGIAETLQTVQHNYLTGTTVAAPPNGRPNPDKQSGMVTGMVAERTWTCWRREFNDPRTKAGEYINRLNAANWDIFPGDEAGTWLCEDIDATEDESTGLYDVGYVFHYKPEGWLHTAYYRGVDGKPPPDIVVGTGTKSFYTNKSKQFTNLRLLSKDG